MAVAGDNLGKQLKLFWFLFIFCSLYTLCAHAKGTDNAKDLPLSAILSTGLAQTQFSDVLNILNAPVLSSPNFCKGFQVFHRQNPTFFPNSRVRNYSKEVGNVAGDTTDYTAANKLVLDDGMCRNYFIENDLNLCGDLLIENQLFVTTGINASVALKNETMHVQHRCHLKDLQYDGDLVVPNANVWVIGNVYVGGNLVVNEINVDAGASIYVGLRGARDSIVASIRSPGSDTNSEPSTTSNSTKIRFQLIFSSLEAFKSFYPSTDEKLQDVAAAYKNNDSLLIKLNCPYLGVNGVPLQFTADDTAQEESRRNFRKKILKAKNRASSRKKSTENEADDAYGDIVAHSIGDVYTANLAIHNGGTLIVYGNVNSELGILLDGASSIYSLCGRVFTPMDDGLGLVLLDSSLGVFNGIGFNHIFQLILQHASSLFVRDLALVASIVQINDASDVLCANSLYTSVLALYDMSKVIIGGKLDASVAVEAADNAIVLVRQDANVTGMQLFDGSQMEVLKNLIATDVIGLDSSAYLVVYGRMLSTSLLHLANRSSIMVPNGDVEVEDHLEMFNAAAYIKRGSFYIMNNAIIASGSTCFVNGNFHSKGRITPSELSESSTAGSTHNIFPEYIQLASDDLEMAHSEDTEMYTTLPALFVESSDLTINGDLDCASTWTEFSRGSSVKVNGEKGLRIREGSLFLVQGSNLKISSGDLNVDLLTVLSTRSNVIVNNGNVYSLHLNMYSMSGLSTANGKVDIRKNMLAEGRSKILVKKAVVVRGSLLYLEERASLVADEITVSGDVFVEDNAKVTTRTGDIMANGSLISQDVGVMSSNKNIVSLQGHVVSENGGKIQAKKCIIAKSGLVRQTIDSSMKADTFRPSAVLFHQDIPQLLIDRFRAGKPSTVSSESQAESQPPPLDPLDKFKNGKRWHGNDALIDLSDAQKSGTTAAIQVVAPAYQIPPTFPNTLANWSTTPTTPAPPQENRRNGPVEQRVSLDF